MDNLEAHSEHMAFDIRNIIHLYRVFKFVISLLVYEFRVCAYGDVCEREKN